MGLQGTVAFEESGFYNWKHRGWEFLIEFNYHPKRFANPNLLIVSPVGPGELMEIRDILSADDLAIRFLRLQREQAAQRGLVPKLPHALTSSGFDKLRSLHRQKWEEGEQHRIYLGA